MALPSFQPDTPLAPRLPLRLGRFTLCEELGAGGMATVYLARMQMAGGLERLVALKTIHPHLAKERPFVDMFLDEARIASHVSHPNVCSTHDFGEVDGVYYLAMEYLLGEPLFDVINRMVERFDETREVLPFLAARIIADSAEGIHAAHSARGPDGEDLHIVHRDVSPQNLFVTYDGAVNVVDFGCAKAAERVAHTSTGVMKGKVGYAAPEQLKSDHVDHRADVWALGVCLWETLTLSPLFSRDTAVKTAMAVLEDEIELASDGRDWVPDEVALIAQRALSRDADERYDSARDLSRDLRKFIADNGFTLESAELAEWMDFLFDDRHVERESQAKRVQEMDISNVAATPLYERSRQSEVAWRADESPAREAIVDQDAVDDTDGGAHFDGDAGGDGAHEPDEGGAAPAAAMSEPPPPLDPSIARAQGRRGWLALLLIVGLSAGGYAYVEHYDSAAAWVRGLLDESANAQANAPPVEPAGRAAPARAATAEPRPTRVRREGPGGGGRGGSSARGGADRSGAERANRPPSGRTGRGEAARGGAGRRSASRGGGVVTTVVSGSGAAPAGSTGATTTSATTTPSGGAASNGAGAPPAAAVGAGFVSIRASSGFAVIYDGPRRLGQTPLRAELPAGTHRLRVLPYGHEPAEVLAVAVEPGVEESLIIDVLDPTQR